MHFNASPSQYATRTRGKGSIMLLVIVFGGIFFTMLVALSGFVLAQDRLQDLTRSHAKAVSIAEAGINYYRWFLIHNPGNTTNGTGLPGPYVSSYIDPEGSSVGTYSLSVTGNTACGVVQSVDVTSVGSPVDAPTVSSSISARYAEPSVATYSYIVGSSVWAGSDRIINGPYHSNGGIRMDGTANAPVSSSLSTWNCTSSFGCSPSEPIAHGVLGSGGNQDLWAYPTPQVDFSGIQSDFAGLKAKAQASGVYLARYSTAGKPHRGYHLIFNADGTVTIKKVTSVTTLASVQPVDASANLINDYTLIDNENNFQTSAIPSSCSLIFVEDNTWIEGTIPSKVTVVVANTVNLAVIPEVVLRGNITYVTQDGSNGLTVIGEHNILIAPDSPMNMILNGTFIAQSGAFGRNYYFTPSGGCTNLYEPRTTLTILGTTVSNLRTGTKWMNGCGGGSDAGYRTRIDAYDRPNSINPPPFTPNTSSTWEITQWQQK